MITGMTGILRCLFAVALIVAVAMSPARAATPNLVPLVSFNGADGAEPLAGLIADAKGDLFGTTVGGGAHGQGTVFEIACTSFSTVCTSYASTPTLLYSFCAQASCTDGAEPFAGLIVDAKGNLFGTTDGGGAHGGGTVFEITKTASGYATTPTILYSFCAQTNCTDGESPFAGLIVDAKGNLFGTTEIGGAPGGGTVFEIAKTTSGYASTPTALVSFCALANCADGSRPEAGLIADAKGNLFGTTRFGGANGSGTVFEIAKTASGYASTPTVLVSFCALANCADGSFPVAGLIADANGNLFGTTVAGGANAGGTVFEIAKTAGGYASTPTTLVNFCSLANCADGATPAADLIADANGNLLSTTFVGGAFGGRNSGGTVYEIVDSGFVVPPIFAGTPGKPNCFGKSISALARQYGGLNAAAEALGYPSVRALQKAILEFCEG